MAWKWFIDLENRGKDASRIVSTIATFAARAMKCGRRLTGMENAKDVMNQKAQFRCNFSVERMPDNASLSSNALTEALADNTVTPPPVAAAFRVDFPRWLGLLPKRDRRLAQELMIGERTLDAARRFAMSAGRVSQLRRALCQDWSRFHGERVFNL